MNLTIWEIFAYLGMWLNDFLAILASIGSFMILILGNRAGRQFLNMAATGIVFGVAFQVILYATDKMPEKIGIFRLEPFFVNALLCLSVLFLVIRIIIRQR